MVEFEAELFNESYEMINQPDVNLTIRDEQDKSFPFLFGKTEKAYYLNAGTFPVGKYTYSASVKVGKNLYQKNGAFVITQMNLETMNLVADHNLLFRLAKEHGGEMVYPKNMDDLVEKINSREDIKPVIYTQKRFSDLVGNLWVFLVILVLTGCRVVHQEKKRNILNNHMTAVFLYTILAILLFDYLLERFLAYLNSTYWNDKLPKELEGIYDQEKYSKSQQYEKQKQRFSFVVDTLTFILMILMLTLGGFAWMDIWVRNFTSNPILLGIVLFWYFRFGII